MKIRTPFNTHKKEEGKNSFNIYIYIYGVQLISTLLMNHFKNFYIIFMKNIKS